MRHQLSTEVNIEAPPATVWAVLTDLDRYHEWNPFIVSSAGETTVGAKLVNRLQPPGGKAMTFKPTVTEVEAERSFEWLGRLVAPGIFDGRHRFELHATDDGRTRLVHEEQFRGVLVRLMRTSLDGRIRQGLELMNAALKTRAEDHVRATC